MNNELENTWKESAAAYFKVVFRHLPRRTGVNIENLTHDSLFPGQNLKPGPIEYEAGVLTTRP